jgi:hypothetical protein
VCIPWSEAKNDSTAKIQQQRLHSGISSRQRLAYRRLTLLTEQRSGPNSRKANCVMWNEFRWIDLQQSIADGGELSTFERAQ